MSQTLFSDDFETGNLSKWAMSVGWAIESSVIHAGSYSAKRAPTSSNGLSGSIGIAAKKFVWDFYFRISSTTGIHSLIVVESGSGGSMTPFRIASGHLQYQVNGNNSNLPTDVVLAKDTWYHVVATLDMLASTVSWVVDGTSKGSVSLVDDQGQTWNASTVIDSWQHVGGSSGFTIYMDDYYIYYDANTVSGIGIIGPGLVGPSPLISFLE